MNQVDIAKAKDPDLRASLQAIQRAALAARAVAVQTNTSIVIVQNAQLVRLSAVEIKKEALHE
jgi:hypothetical protein